MWNFLIKLNKRLVVVVPMMMAAGYLLGVNMEPKGLLFLKKIITPLIFLMVYPMMISLNIKHLQQGIKNVKLQVVTQLINFGIIPFVAYGLGVLYFKDQPYLALGLLLPALLPTSGMTISWTGFAGGNMAAAINMTVVGLTLGALLTPFYVVGMMGAEVAVDMGRVFGQIVVIVFLPMFLGYLTRQALLAKYSLPVFKERIAPRLPALSTVGVLGIVFVAIALKAKAIAASPELLLSIIGPLCVVYSLYYALSTVAARLFFNREDGIALVYGTAMRNLSIAMAIAINAFGKGDGANAALVIAIAYIVQVQSAAWYVKLTDKIFGPVPQ
ncbi:MAG: bile acid:sodium symporter [Desulfobulbaceae bacterium]|nr:bile acid:sodium symporter [Desulfobulbaceae bacterium]HIJ79962.1 arsenic resistance protein [Deltaproteobacteria bacterium]